MPMENVKKMPASAPHEPRWELVVRQFPALDQKVHGHPLVYLDSAATALKPQCVIDAVTKVYAEDCANIHRGVHLLSQRATVAYEEVRTTVKRFVNSPESYEAVFVRGATEGINLVASSFVEPLLGTNDEILITELEHHSNLVPWQLLCERTGAKLVVTPFNEAGEVSVDDFKRRLSSRTRFAAFAHVSNALGTVLPVAELVAAAHEKGVPVLVDGAQALPHVPVDLAEINADFYVFSAHKAYGPTGSGVLFARRSLLETARPYQSGGDMIKSVSFSGTTLNDLPFRFEAGTPNIAGVIGMGAALRFLDDVGMSNIAEHEKELLKYGHQQIQKLEGARLVGRAEKKVGVLSVVLDGVHPHDAGTVLDMEGVAVRAGHHCAQPVMEHYGVAATVRASLGIYNTKNDIDCFVEGLKKAQEMFA